MSDNKTPKTFKGVYAEINCMSLEQVDIILQIQDKQDTKYSRVKTCEALWNAASEATRAEYDDKIKAMQAEIDKLNSEIKHGCIDCALHDCKEVKKLQSDLSN